MKLIKHCHEVNLANLGIAQGALLGLVADTRLEITHCFPFPSVSDESISDEVCLFVYFAIIQSTFRLFKGQQYLNNMLRINK